MYEEYKVNPDTLYMDWS